MLSPNWLPEPYSMEHFVSVSVTGRVACAQHPDVTKLPKHLRDGKKLKRSAEGGTSTFSGDICNIKMKIIDTTNSLAVIIGQNLSSHGRLLMLRK